MRHDYREGSDQAEPQGLPTRWRQRGLRHGGAAAAAAEAKKAAKAALEAIEVGQEFEGAEVVSVMPYGCFVRLQEGIDALVHVSQFSERRNEDARDLVSEGMLVSVSVEGRNDKGKLQLKKISDFTDSDTD